MSPLAARRPAIRATRDGLVTMLIILASQNQRERGLKEHSLNIRDESGTLSRNLGGQYLAL